MTLIAKDVMTHCPVIAVLTFDDPGEAVEQCEALVAGGVTALEITLRTDNALACLKAVAKKVKGGIIGAGSVLTPEQLWLAIDNGAQFLISPGAPPQLMATGGACGVPLIPGVATPTEALSAFEMDLDYLKFFPANLNGGPKTLAAWKAPLGGLTFCPTGGVNLDNMNEYLALDNVSCVGGSWLTKADDIKGIEQNARQAIEMAQKSA